MKIQGYIILSWYTVLKPTSRYNSLDWIIIRYIQCLLQSYHLYSTWRSKFFNSFKPQTPCISLLLNISQMINLSVANKAMKWKLRDWSKISLGISSIYILWVYVVKNNYMFTIYFENHFMKENITSWTRRWLLLDRRFKENQWKLKEIIKFNVTFLGRYNYALVMCKKSQRCETSSVIHC